MSWLKKAFGGGKAEKLMLWQAMQAAEAQKAAAQATVAATEKAAAAQARAAQSPADNEDSRQASERRLRKLVSQRGLQTDAGAGFGDAPVLSKMLLGS